MNFWQTFFGVSKGQVCTFACTSIIDFRAFRMPGKTILQHNINQPGPLSDHPKRDIIYRVTRTATVSVSTGLCVKHRRVASDDWYSLDVALFHFLSCTYLRCASSITTINVCVSSSYSAMNCFALVRKSILLVLERYFIKSLAPIRIQSFFTRGAKS